VIDQRALDIAIRDRNPAMLRAIRGLQLGILRDGDTRVQFVSWYVASIIAAYHRVVRELAR
jgi:hypothetical protein